ncbi:MAG: hypothetical protein GXY58_10310 [Planctomycetaceae bacterium]|nr:hypothetical protein [Planctomycetaceae bacterium]
MEKPDAVSQFRGPDRHNCAQAVLKAYACLTGVDCSCLERFTKLGGGRAPAGECGALYAAKAMLTDVAAQRTLHAAFVQAAGAAGCREIRRLGRLSCHQCVETAADEVFARLGDGQTLRKPAECDGATS